MRSNADLEKTFVPNSLSLAEVIAAFHESGTVFLDVRESNYFKYGHIQGALSLPFDQIQAPETNLLWFEMSGWKVIAKDVVLMWMGIVLQFKSGNKYE